MQTPTFSTADTILTQVRAETGIGTNSISTALQTTALLRRLNDVNIEFVNYPYSQGILGWQFLDRETVIETIAQTTLDGAISSGDTSLILTNSTGWDSPSGAIAGGFIKTGNFTVDFFTYTGLSTNTLSTVSGIDMDHADDENCQKIYKLPSDFGKLRNIFYQSTFTEYFVMDDDFRQLPPRQHVFLKYLINGTLKGAFMVFADNIGVREFHVRYIKKAEAIDETTDIVDAPDGAGRRFLTEKMKEYVWNILGEENDASIALQRSQRALIETTAQWTVNQVQPRSSSVFYF